MDFAGERVDVSTTDSGSMEEFTMTTQESSQAVFGVRACGPIEILLCEVPGTLKIIICIFV